MQRFKGIAALLVLVLMMPLPRACAAISRGATVQQGCCKQHIADPCCEGSSELCAAQAPADTTLYPIQDVALLVLPPATVAVVHLNRLDSLESCCVALHLPAQYSPHGLVIVATTVLRI